MSRILPIDVVRLDSASRQSLNLCGGGISAGNPAGVCSTSLLLRMASVQESGREYCPEDKLEPQYAAVRRFLETLCHNHDLAKDLAQQTYLRAYLHLARHETLIRMPREWLFTVARRTYIDHVRYAALRPVTCPDALDLVVETKSGDCAESLQVREEVAKLNRAIEELDPISRDLLLSHHVEGQCFATLAARHGLSETAARVRVFRARQKLRRGRSEA